jgi:hypothetical protein
LITTAYLVPIFKKLIREPAVASPRINFSGQFFQVKISCENEWDQSIAKRLWCVFKRALRTQAYQAHPYRHSQTPQGKATQGLGCQGCLDGSLQSW